MTRRTVPAEERFWAKVNKTDACWLWTAHVKPNGYGWFKGDKLDYAHRHSLRFAGVQIPTGMEVDHLCRVRNCVNPAHLEVVTPRVNSHRSMSPSGINAAKSLCPKGHQYTVYARGGQRGNGHRRCLTCNAENNRRWRAARIRPVTTSTRWAERSAS